MIRRTACLLASGTEPCRNLAVEKHLLDTLPEDTAILYLWQSERAVDVGYNQHLPEVCKVQALMQDGGTVARRMSGGSESYQDAGTVGFTMVLPKTEFDISRQLGVVGMAIGALGVQVRAAGRGDLYAFGRRVSTSAYYKSGSAAYHRGTLNVCTDEGAAARYLTGEPMGNLSDISSNITVESLQQSLYGAFGRVYGAQPAWLDERMMDSRSIEKLTGLFASPQWICPPEKPYTFSVTERFPWGHVTARLNVEGGIIREAALFTDAMEAPLFGRIEQLLTGSPFLISAIAGRFNQRLKLLTDRRLQLAGDVCNLICGRIRAMDRQGEQPKE